MDSGSDQELQRTIVEPRSASQPDAEEQEVEPGPEIGRYLVIDEIGAGGMGRVFRAYDPKLGREVALKRLRLRSGAKTDGARMLREAKAMALLSHPNVVSIYDVDIDHGTLFIAMEYVRGHTLKTWVAKSGAGWREVLAMFVQAGRGLAAAHAQGIVHRDFKPGNVMVGEDGRPRVMDFGLARAVGESDAEPLPDALAHDSSLAAFDSAGGGRDLGATLTAHGTVVGTPAYMAPEQHLGEAIDARTDQYAFCVALWEALYRRVAFPGRDARMLATAKLAGPPRPVPGTGVPSAIHAVLAQGLASEPTKRWPDMQALLAALERASAGPGRRWAMAAVPGVLLVGALAWSRRDPPCAGSEAELDEVWNAAARARVEQALRASDASYALTTIERVTATIDAQAEAWTAMHRDTCEATKVRHEQSDEALDLRMSCLRAHREELGAMIELLATADAALTQRAVEVAGGLPPLARCADVAALRERVPPPDRADAREDVAAVRARLEQAQLQARAGRLPEALAIAESARADASATGYEPVVVEAQIQLGAILLVQGRADEARPLLEQGFEDALVHRDHRSAGRAALELAAVIAREGGHKSRTEWLSRAALGLAEGDGSDARLISRALIAYGDTYANRELELEAEPYYAAAVTRLEDALGPDHPELVEPLSMYALIVRALGRHEDATALQLRALTLAERAYGPDHPQVAQPLRLIGLDALLQASGAEALSAFDRIIAIYLPAFGPDDPSTLEAQALRATALAMLERYDEAVALADDTIERVNRALPDVHGSRASMLHNIAMVFTIEGDHARAAELFREVVRVRRAVGQRSTLAAGLTSLGRELQASGQLDEAERVLVEAAQVEAEVHADDGVHDTNAAARLGALLRERGELERARRVLEEALARVPDDDDSVQQIDARAQLGMLLWELDDDRPRAVALVERAYERVLRVSAKPAVERAQELRAWLDTHVLPLPEDPLAR